MTRPGYLSGAVSRPPGRGIYPGTFGALLKSARARARPRHRRRRQPARSPPAARPPAFKCARPPARLPACASPPRQRARAPASQLHLVLTFEAARRPLLRCLPDAWARDLPRHLRCAVKIRTRPRAPSPPPPSPDCPVAARRPPARVQLLRREAELTC